jgi:hypothetical protein
MDLPVGISTLQRPDRRIGVPLCAILTIFRRIFESTGPRGPRQVRRILFVKFAEQGSTVLAYPAIRRAIEMVGRGNVYFVVFEDNLSVEHWIGLAPRRALSEAGQYLSRHAAPDDRIFVWGQTSKIYLDAHRRPASRYIETFPLTGFVFGGAIPGFDTRSRVLPGAWATLMQDFVSIRPPTSSTFKTQVERSTQ